MNLPTAGYASRTALAPSGSARWSCRRELISSLANTLPRWYWTVRGLRTSWAAISGLGSAVTASMVAAENSVAAQGRKLTGGAIDVTGDTLTAIKGGQLAFALNQQPFAQGYLPVIYLYQYLKYGVTAGMSDIFTGPAVVNAQNVNSQQGA